MATRRNVINFEQYVGLVSKRISAIYFRTDHSVRLEIIGKDNDARFAMIDRRTGSNHSLLIAATTLGRLNAHLRNFV